MPLNVTESNTLRWQKYLLIFLLTTAKGRKRKFKQPKSKQLRIGKQGLKVLGQQVWE